MRTACPSPRTMLQFERCRIRWPTVLACACRAIACRIRAVRTGYAHLRCIRAPYASGISYESCTVASQVAYRQTNLDLTGLVPFTEYTVMVLPRNGKGWGSRWSEPLRATTDPTVLPPQKAAAPAVRPAEGCRAAYVRVPTASTGCRSLAKSAPPGSGGWARPLWLLRVHLTAPGG